MSKKCGTEREEVDIRVIFFRTVLASHTQSTLSIFEKPGCVRVFMYGSFKRLYREDFKKVVQAPPMQLPGERRCTEWS